MLLLLLSVIGGPATPETVYNRGNIMDGIAALHFTPVSLGAISLTSIDFMPVGGLHTITPIEREVL